MVFVCIYGEITRFIETFVGYLRPQEVLKGREPLLAENGLYGFDLRGRLRRPVYLVSCPQGYEQGRLKGNRK